MTTDDYDLEPTWSAAINPVDYLSTACSTKIVSGVYLTRENLDNIINNLFDMLEAIHPDLPYMHPLMLELEELVNTDIRQDRPRGQL